MIKADLAGATKEQASHSLLDVCMAKDVGRNAVKNALVHIRLGCKGLELGLLLHAACTHSCHGVDELANCP